MSTLMVTVCEECGKQSANCEGWLVIESLDLKAAKGVRSFVNERGIDLCSQGCVLRYVSRMMERGVSMDHAARPALTEEASRALRHVSV
jgi:hypothetical protein